jgi:hypothetical protein
MNRQPSINRALRLVALLVLITGLSGCLYWWRAYEVYLQMNDFDRYFSVESGDKFTLHFKEPVLYNSDFVALANLYPSEDNPTAEGRQTRYWFRKVNADNQTSEPEITFYSEMDFNKDKRLAAWSFSSLFLEIAPPRFLEVSLRSIGGANIDKEKRQLKADTDKIGKIVAELPKKQRVLAKLGEPFAIKEEADKEIYIYHFLLDTPRIEKGHEANALNEVKLSFDKNTDELFNMAGNFAGLKVSIDYRKFLSAHESGS